MGALALVWCRVSKLSSQKTHFDAKGGVHVSTNFRYIRTFLRVHLLVTFQVTSVSKKFPFSDQRGPKRRFLGSHFEAISRLVVKVRMKLPCKREHRFQG